MRFEAIPGPLNPQMERAGMSEMDICNRTRDVFRHYKLPYDQPPPEEWRILRSLSKITPSGKKSQRPG